MNNRIFTRIAALSVAMVSALVITATPGLADATNPTADIDGASDNALVKRYDAPSSSRTRSSPIPISPCLSRR
ncbi:hypothetical protein [Mesorhizobium amorphae]|uniref:hypothetical protein n=1 Tax=Mesorhizobium amorphae TaxID=71433 RepID=UPI0021B42914|nr:hypothetical protein [Mesorhizobium amorphae]